MTNDTNTLAHQTAAQLITLSVETDRRIEVQRGGALDQIMRDSDLVERVAVQLANGVETCEYAPTEKLRFLYSMAS